MPSTAVISMARSLSSGPPSSSGTREWSSVVAALHEPGQDEIAGETPVAVAGGTAGVCRGLSAQLSRGDRHECARLSGAPYGILILKVPTGILAVSSSACMSGPVA